MHLDHISTSSPPAHLQRRRAQRPDGSRRALRDRPGRARRLRQDRHRRRAVPRPARPSCPSPSSPTTSTPARTPSSCCAKPSCRPSASQPSRPAPARTPPSATTSPPTSKPSRTWKTTLGPLDLVLVESGGDNLTATFSKGLVDAQIFVIDVASGDDIPRKGGPGITTADLLVVNKTDLAPLRRLRPGHHGPRRERPSAATSPSPSPPSRPRAASNRSPTGSRGRLTHWTRRPRMTLATEPTAPRRPSRHLPPGRTSHRPHHGQPDPAAGTTTLPSSTATGPSTCGACARAATPARVCVIGAMSAPLGGDRLRIEATAEAGRGPRRHLCRRHPRPARPHHRTRHLRRAPDRRRARASCAGCPSR